MQQLKKSYADEEKWEFNSQLTLMNYFKIENLALGCPIKRTKLRIKNLIDKDLLVNSK